MRKLMTLLALSLLCSSAMGQQIYQWTDERGVVQFGQLPPADTPYHQRDIRAPAPIGGELRKPAPLQTETDTTEADARAEQRQQQREQAEQLLAYCAQLRGDLATMQNNPRLRRTNADGEVERIGEDERQRLIQATQQNLQEQCQSAG